MRIITGDFKGRKIEMPDGYDIRPTTEKVKEAIFSTIQTYIPEALVCDLFTGTGNLGLEALSRGADKCYFCDNSRQSIELTRRNISHCNADEYAVVLPGDFEKCLNRLHERELKFDIFILDPPYKEGLYDRCFGLIDELELLDDYGIILAEHKSNDVFPDEWYSFAKIKDKKFGTIAFTIYKKKTL